MTSEKAVPVTQKRIAQGMIRAELMAPTIEPVKNTPLKKIVQDILIYNDSEVDIPNASFFLKFSSRPTSYWRGENNAEIDGPMFSAILYDAFDEDGQPLNVPLVDHGEGQVHILETTILEMDIPPIAPLSARSFVRLNLFYYASDSTDHKIPLIEEVFVGPVISDPEMAGQAGRPRYNYDRDGKETNNPHPGDTIQSTKVQNVGNALFHEPHVIWSCPGKDESYGIKKISGNIAEKFDVVEYEGRHGQSYLISSRIQDDNSKGDGFVVEYSLSCPAFISYYYTEPFFIGIPARLTRT